MEKLSELRKAENLSLRAVADIVGLTPQAIRHYELGDREPTIATLKKLSEYFNVSIDYLVGNEISGKIIFNEKQKQIINTVIELNDKNLDIASAYIKALIDTQKYDEVIR